MLKFTDDVGQKLIGRMNSAEDVDRLRIDLTRLGGWAEKWQMMFNVEKCKVIIRIWESSFIKISRLVKCFKSASKGNQVMGMIKRTFTSRSKEIIISYKSLVRPWTSRLLRPCLEAASHKGHTCGRAARSELSRRPLDVVFLLRGTRSTVGVPAA